MRILGPHTELVFCFQLPLVLFCVRVCIFLHWLFAFFVFAAVSEFSVAFVLHVFGLRRKAKCEKKVQPNPEDDRNAKANKPGSGGRPKCKKSASLQTEAGQNLPSLPKSLKVWKIGSVLGAFAFVLHFFVFFCSLLQLFAFFCRFFAFWQASVDRLAFFLHFGRPPLPGLLAFCVLVVLRIWLHLLFAFCLVP